MTGESNTFLANKKNRMSLCAFAVAVLMLGMAAFAGVFKNQKEKILDPLQHDQLNSKGQVIPQKKEYKRPPPIKYYQTGNSSGQAHCTHNSKSDYCCSEEHCATIVQRSTLYSECCHNLHNNATGSRSKIFPLLVTSGPRSGTWFMQQLFTKTGLQGLTTDEYSPEHLGTVSWKHIFSQDGHYFGLKSISHLYRSKFRMIWHLVRDPLHSLTSIAYTDPLWEDSEHSRLYVGYLSHHIPLTSKADLFAKYNITEGELEHVLDHRTMTTKSRNPKLDQYLVWRALEIYLYWHSFINYLNVPIFRIEDLSVDKNVTVLNEIFKSVGRTLDHDKALDILNAQHRRRWRRRLQNAYKRTKRIRKGSRIHREQLTWAELCAVSDTKAKAMLRMSHSFGYYLETPLEGLCDS